MVKRKQKGNRNKLLITFIYINKFCNMLHAKKNMFATRIITLYNKMQIKKTYIGRTANRKRIITEKRNFVK